MSKQGQVVGLSLFEEEVEAVDAQRLGDESRASTLRRLLGFAERPMGRPRKSPAPITIEQADLDFIRAMRSKGGV